MSWVRISACIVAIMTEIFRVFPQAFQINAEIDLESTMILIFHDLSNSQSSCGSTQTSTSGKEQLNNPKCNPRPLQISVGIIL